MLGLLIIQTNNPLTRVRYSLRCENVRKNSSIILQILSLDPRLQLVEIRAKKEKNQTEKARKGKEREVPIHVDPALLEEKRKNQKIKLVPTQPHRKDQKSRHVFREGVEKIREK